MSFLQSQYAVSRFGADPKKTLFDFTFRLRHNPLTLQNGIICGDFMDEFLPPMKLLHTSKNTPMGYSAAYPTGAERIVDEGRAILSSEGRYTSFSYGGNTIRFLTSPRLLRYEKVLKWDNGYLEVIANYNGKEEESIQRVEVSYGN